MGGLGALFTLADIVSSNLKGKKLANLLRDRGVDEVIIKDAIGAVSYLNLSEKDKRKIYRRNASLDRTDVENKMRATLLYIFQLLEVAELILGNRKKAIQVNKEAKAFFEQIEKQENEKGLSLSQVEARILQFSIINYVDKLTMSDEERKQLKDIAEFMKIKTDPVSSHGNISLDISNEMFISLDGLLHFFKTDSEMASIYGSIRADSFIGDTGVRLSEMASYTHIMDGLIEKISKRIE